MSKKRKLTVLEHETIPCHRLGCRGKRRLVVMAPGPIIEAADVGYPQPKKVKPLGAIGDALIAAGWRFAR